MKALEEMTNAEIELNGRAAGLLLMHVLPAYRALCGTHEAAVVKINELLKASDGIKYDKIDTKTVLYNILQINA